MRSLAPRLAFPCAALVLLASTTFLVAGSQPRPPQPDVIVGDIPDVRIWGSQGDVTAYSFGTTSCNIGQRPLDWLRDPNPTHPVIAQNLYRVKDGRIEQLSMSWLKHGFAVAAGNLCGDCQDDSSVRLGVNCSDPYSASLNGSQVNLGPRSEVNASTGVFRAPFTHLPNQPGVLTGRLQVRRSDVDPVLNPGAAYFIEAEYVHPQDAAAGNGANNASHRPLRIAVEAGGPVLRLNPAAPTVRTSPVITGWAALGPGATSLFNVDVPGDGRMILGVRTTRAGGGFHHEIALQNINSDRCAGSLEVRTAGGSLSSLGFHAPTYDREPYSSDPWTMTTATGSATWATTPFATNPNANALRWATLYSFWLDTDQPIQSVTVGLFKPGTPASVGPIVIPPPPPPTSLAVQSATAAPPEVWVSAPDDAEVSVGGDAASFRVYAIPGSKAGIAKVTSSSPAVRVDQAGFNEGGVGGWDIRLVGAPDAPKGYFEAIITLESTEAGHPPKAVRAFGRIE